MNLIKIILKLQKKDWIIKLKYLVCFNKVFFFFQFTPNPSWKKKNEKIKIPNNEKIIQQNNME
jgi:hypothetical protein